MGTDTLLLPYELGLDGLKQKTIFDLYKFDAPDLGEFDTPTLEELLEHCGDYVERVHQQGNLLMYGGASCQWETLIGNGTNTGSGNLQFFNAANTYIGAGDSTTAEAATQTDLQASTNKFRQLVSSVTHTDGTTSPAASIVFAASFALGNANYAWQEWALFNNATTGRMLNRKVVSLGTKPGTQVWVATATLTLA